MPVTPRRSTRRATARRAAAVVAASAALFAAAAPVASAATHEVESTSAIAIPHAGAATPYPSTITVDAPGELVSKVTVSLTIAHTILSEAHVLLEAPDGTAVMLMSRVGCAFSYNVFEFTFSQDAVHSLPGQAVPASGTYLPTANPSNECWYPEVTLPAPAPSAWTTSLETFEGGPAGGEWKLYAYDDIPGDSGTISRWSLEIETLAAPVITSAASATGALDTPFTHEITVTGDPAPSIAVGTTALPEGLALVGTAITGTPRETGTFTVPVTASNGVGSNATQDLVIEIVEAPAGPVIALADGQADVTNAQPVEFTLTFPEAASGLSVSDVTLDGTAGGGSVSLSGSGTTYTATVSDLTSDGTVSISIPDGSWHNADGFLGRGATGPEVVLDTVAPEIEGPEGDVVRTTTDPGQPGATVEFDFLAPPVYVPVAALDPEDTVECAPASGSFFPIGTTATSCTATDPAGNSASVDFDVIVVDDEAPVIGSVADVTIQLADGESTAPVAFEPPSATDNSGEVEVTCDLAPGTQLPAGERTVTCTAVDPSANEATSQFQVAVLAADEGPDNEAPDEEAPDEEAPDEEAPDEEAPDEEAPDEEAPDEEAPDEEAPDEEATDDDATEDEELPRTGATVGSVALLAVVMLAAGAYLVAQRRRLTE